MRPPVGYGRDLKRHPTLGCSGAPALAFVRYFRRARGRPLNLTLGAFTDMPLYETANLAGFFAAHAIWCVSDGEPLIPMLAYEHVDGAREMNRLAADRFEEGVAIGRQWLEENPHGATRAVLVYDGYIRLESGRTDTLIIDAVEYQPTRWSFRMYVPYRSVGAAGGFAVYRPKFAEFEGADEPPVSELAEAFFAGVDSHEPGSAVWNEHLDQGR